MLVGSSGLEPPTSRLSGVRSNRLSYEPPFCVRALSFALSLRSAILLFRKRQPSGCGGDERNRTADPLLARQVLSQLSYTPRVWVVP